MEENTKSVVVEIPKPVNPNDPVSNFEAFVEIVKLLRLHCPWDRAQTNESIAHLMVEEVYETTDAIYRKNDKEFAKELGDLLLHIILHSVMAEERGAFTFMDVVKGITNKMVTRHPHVFGETVVKDQDEVMKNWEQIKMNEGIKSILDGVPNSLPALLRAERIQHKASRVGFDWDDKNDVWNKVDEELGELRHEISSGNKTKAREEFGDFLFALVNAARHENLVAEEALQLTNDKFKNRFQYIEKSAKDSGRNLRDMTLGEMDEIWNESKKLFP